MRGQRNGGKFELRQVKLKCLGVAPRWKESLFFKNILDLGFLNKGTYIIKVDGYLVKKLIKN